MRDRWNAFHTLSSDAFGQLGKRKGTQNVGRWSRDALIADNDISWDEIVRCISAPHRYLVKHLAERMRTQRPGGWNIFQGQFPIRIDTMVGDEDIDIA